VKRHWFVVRRVRYPYMLWPGRWPLTRLYSQPDGGICLRTETTWSNWSGIGLRLGHVVVWAYFRRGTQW
jgi:hypothetical protein